MRVLDRAELIHRVGRWPVPIIVLIAACLMMTATAVWARHEPKVAAANVASAATGVRLSKLRGATVSNGTQKIGTLDDLVVPDRSLFGVIDVGHYVGEDDRYVAVQLSSPHIEGKGARIVLPGAAKAKLKAMPPFKYAEDQQPVVR